jgi:hypothetical protein
MNNDVNELRQKIQAKLAEREGPTPGSFRAAQEAGTPPSWGETLTPIPEKVAELGRMAVGGGREMLGQAITPAESVRDPQTGQSIPLKQEEPNPAIQAVRDWLITGGREQARQAYDRIRELTPEHQTFWQEAVSTAGTSLGMQAPLFVLGMFSRRPGLVTASGFGVQELGRAYAEAKQQDPNISEDRAVRHAFLSGLLETGTELGPAKVLFAPGSKGLKRMINFMAMELPGENVAEVGQLFSEYINGLRDDITAKEVIDTMKLTSAATLLAGGAQVAASNLIHDAKRRLTRPSEPEPTPLAVPKSQGAHLRYISAEGDRYDVPPGQESPPQMRGEQPVYERGRPIPEEVPMQQIVEGEQQVRDLTEESEKIEGEIRRKLHEQIVPQEHELTPEEERAVEEDKQYWQEREMHGKRTEDIGPRPTLTSGDMEGMAPKERTLLERDNVGVEYYDTPDGIYAMYKGREVGFALPMSEDPAQGFDVSVAKEWGRKGVGGNLMRHFLKKNPNYPTGGLTQAGRGMAEKAGLVGKKTEDNRLISTRRTAVADTTLGDLVEDLNAYGPDVEPHQHKRAFNALRKRLRAAIQLGDGTVEKGEVGEGHDQVWMRLTPEQQAKGLSSRGFVDTELGFLRGEDELPIDSTDLLTEEEQRQWLRDYQAMKGITGKATIDPITGKSKKPKAVERAMDRMAKDRVRTGDEEVDAAVAEAIHGTDKLKVQRAKNILRKRLRPAVQYTHPTDGPTEEVVDEGEGHLHIETLTENDAVPETIVWGYKDLRTGEFHDVGSLGGLDATDLMTDEEIKMYLRLASGGKLTEDQMELPLTGGANAKGKSIRKPRQKAWWEKGSVLENRKKHIRLLNRNREWAWTDGTSQAVKRFGRKFVDQLYDSARDLGFTLTWVRIENRYDRKKRKIDKRVFGASLDPSFYKGLGGMVQGSATLGFGGGSMRYGVIMNAEMGSFKPDEVLAHEFGHVVAANAPDLWNDLSNFAQVDWKTAITKSHQNYLLREGVTPVKLNAFKEEILGDALSNQLFTKEFQARVAKHDPAFAARVVARLKILLAKMKAVFERYDGINREFDTYFKNYDALLDKWAETIAKYRQRDVAAKATKAFEGKGEAPFRTSDVLGHVPLIDRRESMQVKDFLEAVDQLGGSSALVDLGGGRFAEIKNIGPAAQAIRDAGYDRMKTDEVNRKMTNDELDDIEFEAWERDLHKAFESGDRSAINLAVQRAAASAPKKQKLLGLDSNAKTIKGQEFGFLTGILYLSPSKSSGFNLCPKASAGCIAACLNTAGLGRFRDVQQSRLQKTMRLFDNREKFMRDLTKEIEAVKKSAHKKGMVPVIRLNGTSDEVWEASKYKIDGKTIMEHFPEVQFYDYTKIGSRVVKWAEGKLPPNYHLTFSRSEDNDKEAVKVLKAGGTVAVVFRDGLPDTWKGFPVVNGDQSDLRHRDPPGVVVGLVAKGRGKSDESGFVVDLPFDEISYRPPMGHREKEISGQEGGYYNRELNRYVIRGKEEGVKPKKWVSALTRAQKNREKAAKKPIKVKFDPEAGKTK